MLNVKFKLPNDVTIKLNALVDTGSPVSLIKYTEAPIVSGNVPPDSVLLGINGSKLRIVDQFLADVSHAELYVRLT